MKKVLLLLVCFMITSCMFFGVSYAQDPGAPVIPASVENEKAEHHKDGMKHEGDMCGMGHGMKGMMMKKEIVPTADGGVVIMSCNKVQKYDKDLNLVKEIELACDPAAMKAMMKKCHEAMEGEEKGEVVESGDEPNEAKEALPEVQSDVASTETKSETAPANQQK
jgi:hypothetical protein